MQKYWNNVLDEQGRPRYGASVAVQQSGVNSTIYSDSSGLVPKANPLTTDATRGYFDFFAAAGVYDLVVTGVGFASYTITAGAEVGLPSGDVTFVQSGTGALASDLQTRGRLVVFVQDYMTAAQKADVLARTALVDVTAAIQAAENAYSGQVILRMPAGTYLISDTVTFDQARTSILGDGQQATIIRFAPTTTGKAAFHFKLAAASTIAQCAIKGIAFDATGNTQGTKSALRITDAEEIIIDDVAVSNWSSVAKDCIGLQFRGRQAHDVSHYLIAADKPISIEDNPNSIIDIDHYHFTNGYLIADSNPHVTVASGVNLSNVTFDGYQAWVGGTHGFYWVDTTSSQVSQSLVLKNIRWEQGTSATADQIHIEHNTGLQGLVVENVYGGTDRDGPYLRKVTDVVLNGYQYVGTGVALDANATVKRIRGLGCFWQAGSTVVLAGQNLIWGVSKNPATGALPPDFYYDETANTQRSVTIGGPITGGTITLAANATAELFSPTAQGTLLITASNGVSAQYMLNGANHSVYENLDPAGQFSPTAGSAFTNIYWSAGNARYEIENKLGAGTLSYSVTLIGRYETFP